jgi:hypothetical protein
MLWRIESNPPVVPDAPSEKATARIDQPPTPEEPREPTIDIPTKKGKVAIPVNYLWPILYRQPICTFASLVDGDTLSARSLPICRGELLSYLER